MKALGPGGFWCEPGTNTVGTQVINIFLIDLCLYLFACMSVSCLVSDLGKFMFRQ